METNVLVKTYRGASIREYFEDGETLGYCWGWSRSTRNEEGYFDTITDTERSIDDRIADDTEQAVREGRREDTPCLAEPWWSVR